MQSAPMEPLAALVGLPQRPKEALPDLAPRLAPCSYLACHNTCPPASGCVAVRAAAPVGTLVPVGCEGDSGKRMRQNVAARAYPCRRLRTDESTASLIRLVRSRVAAAPAADSARAAKRAGGEPAEEARPAKKRAGDADGQPRDTAASAARVGAGPSSASEPMDLTSLHKLTLPQLKELVRARGLAVSGNKQQLITRLVTHQREAREAEMASKAKKKS